ncbi:MFS transporter [Solwaraspora sp. WMMA2080]|uniref:MFS transporter n=1 Tax=unclassified Solwaraspora TaxID=2627926 RepID=UPI00248CDE75|nr:MULTISPECIES: MFS transporter [unclassified Solwaraspora]WBB99181.1 MFS transporter [Solwaraspora sp. WMMA2059]WBC22266.1 MFS transporter [Solwaraspora sp. WMMA2080]
MTGLTARQVHRRYLILHGLRWAPVGLLIPVWVLLMLERGLTLPQIGLVVAAQGLAVLLLELPTGGLADAIGRKPVLIGAAAANLASLSLLAVADSFALFVAVMLLQGLYRALESGPLESWYVDATLAADPDARYEGGLSHGGVVLGLAIAAGSLASGGLVALGPVGPVSALTGPVLVAALFQVVGLVGLVLLLVEARPAAGAPVAGGQPAPESTVGASIRRVPSVVRDALALLRRSRVLVALVAVELFWGFGMVAFETLMPVRLAEVTGDAERAAALLGPVGAFAWLASAGGAALVPAVARRLGAPVTAAAFRVLQGATVVAMALLAGPVGVIVAYLACYAIHGASNPVHMGLLHRQVDGSHRTSVLSLNSMVAQPAGALGGVVLMAIAGAASVSLAMLVGAVVLAAAAPLYLVSPGPSWIGRRGRWVWNGRPTEPPRRI